MFGYFDPEAELSDARRRAEDERQTAEKMRQRMQEYKEENARLTEEKEQYTAAWREIMAEHCSGKSDGVHCTCVPDLILKIREMTEENAALRRLLRECYQYDDPHYPTPDAAIDAALAKMRGDAREDP